MYKIALDLEVYGVPETYDQVMQILKPIIPSGRTSAASSTKQASRIPGQPLPQPLQDLMQAASKVDLDESRKVLVCFGCLSLNVGNVLKTVLVLLGYTLPTRKRSFRITFTPFSPGTMYAVT